MQARQESNLFPIVENKSDLSATMHIDLQDYFTAYDAGVAAYSDYRSRFAQSLEIEQIFIAQRFLDAATSACTVSEHQAIESSPAWQLTRESIYEIVKNGIDAVISAHNSDGRTNQLDLTLQVQLTAGEVQLTLQDNGNGFPPSFLDKVNSPQKQRAFMKAGGSEKRGSKKTDGVLPDAPEYFGGHGQGLRELVEKIIDKPRAGGVAFNKPARSEIVFRNNERSSGAIIQVTTSEAPLVAFKEDFSQPEEFKRGLKSFVPSYLRHKNTPMSASPLSMSSSPTSIGSKSSSDTNAVMNDDSSFSTSDDNKVGFSDGERSAPPSPVDVSMSDLSVIAKQQQIKIALQMETNQNEPKEPDAKVAP